MSETVDKFFNPIDYIVSGARIINIFFSGLGCIPSASGKLDELNSELHDLFPGKTEDELATHLAFEIATAFLVLKDDPRIQPPFLPVVASEDHVTDPIGQLCGRLFNGEEIDLSALTDSQRQAIDIMLAYMELGRELGICLVEGIGVKVPEYRKNLEMVVFNADENIVSMSSGDSLRGDFFGQDVFVVDIDPETGSAFPSVDKTPFPIALSVEIEPVLS